MAFCNKCGTQMADGAKFCASCGNPTPVNQQQYQQSSTGSTINDIMNTADTTGSYHPQDIANNKFMAVLAYLGLLVLIPIFAAKESPFARFHSNQGLILLIGEVILLVAMSILNAIILAISWRLIFLTSLITIVVWLAILAFVVLGIVNAASGRAKELPFIGKIRLIN